MRSVEFVSTTEKARRARLAIAYSGKTLEALVAETDIREGTIRNMTSRTRASGHGEGRLERLGVACGVPAWFMRYGFKPPRDVFDASSIEHRVAWLEGAVSALLEAVVDGETPAPPGELGRRIEALLTSARDRGLPDSLPAPDVEPDSGGS